MLDEDVLTVLSVSRFGGVADMLVPAVGRLVGLNLLVGGLAVRLLGRATRSTAA